VRKRSIFGLASLAVALAGCGGSSSSSSTSTPSSASSSSTTASSTSTAPPTSAPAAAGGSTVHLSAVAGKLAFNVKKLSAKTGTVTLSMANPSSFQHGVAIEGNGVDKDGKIVGQGGTSTVTLKLKPGTYTFYCPVPGHRQAGMQGMLIVQ
jgi:plastocyanin